MRKMEKSETKIDGNCDGGVKIDTPISNDKYQEVAEEITGVIKEHTLDSRDLKNQIVDVLKRRFDVDKENIGKILMDDTTMFNLDTGHTFTIPMFGMLAFAGFRTRPISSDKCFPNYDTRNKYIGYTENGVFHKVNMLTRFVDGVKREPNLVIIGIFTGYLVAKTILGV